MRARPVLLVDDYPLQTAFCLFVKRRLGRAVVHVTTATDAIAKLKRPFTFGGLLLDIKLSDDPGAATGFEVLAHARRLEPRIPAAILTGHLDVQLVSRAAELGALYVPKGASPENLEGFFADVVDYDGRSSIDEAVDHVLARLNIDPAQAAGRVLRLHARGLSPTEVRAQLGIKPNTYKGHCRELRQTSGSNRVIDLVREIWARAAGRSPAK